MDFYGPINFEASAVEVQEFNHPMECDDYNTSEISFVELQNVAKGEMMESTGDQSHQCNQSERSYDSLPLPSYDSFVMYLNEAENHSFENVTNSTIIDEHDTALNKCAYDCTCQTCHPAWDDTAIIELQNIALLEDISNNSYYGDLTCTLNQNDCTTYMNLPQYICGSSENTKMLLRNKILAKSSTAENVTTGVCFSDIDSSFCMETHQLALPSLQFVHNAQQQVATQSSFKPTISVGSPPTYNEAILITIPSISNNIEPSAPPTYDSLYGRIRKDRKRSKSFVCCFTQFLVSFLRAIGHTIRFCTIIVIPVFMIVFGSMYFYQCPQNDFIPVHILIGGIVALLHPLLGYFSSHFCQNNDIQATSNNILSGIRKMTNWLMLGWFAVASFWIYRIYEPNYDSNNDLYCNKMFYTFCYWLVTSVFIAFLMVIVYAWGICIGLCLCSDIAMAHLLVLKKQISFAYLIPK